MKNFFKKIIVPILTWQAMHLLGRFQPQVIAVTGSVGKTSTKEAIYTLIREDFEVRKSEKSFNSEIGVPLTILGLPTAWSNPFKWIWNLIRGFGIAFFAKDYPEILILEIGADRPGDIGSIVSWLKPDIAVVTALADVPVHVENFPSIEAVYEEKAKLVRAVNKEGVVVLNEDDKRVVEMAKLTMAKVVTFGMKNLELVGHNKTSNIYPSLAAAIVAKELGISADKIGELSKNIQTPQGRMNVLSGINGSTIIDDTYNSSPIAAESALNTLKDKGGRRIAVLGDMAELGQHSESEHKRIGEIAKKSSDILITVGPKSEVMGAEKKFNNPELAAKYLKEIIKEGDVILVKGSQSMRMEKAVLEILDKPEENRKFLVRQDKEWQKR